MSGDDQEVSTAWFAAVPASYLRRRFHQGLPTRETVATTRRTVTTMRMTPVGDEPSHDQHDQEERERERDTDHIIRGR